MRKLWIHLLLTLAFLGIAAVQAQASEIYVDPAGHTDGAYASLTEAVAVAGLGDTIYLLPGVYAEPVEEFPIEIDKTLTILGQDGVVMEGAAFKAMLRVTAPGVTVEGVDFMLLKWAVLGLGDELTLRDCAFQLADATYRVSSTGVWLAGVKRATVENCAFVGSGLCMAGPALSERSSSMPVLTGLFEVGDDLDFFTTHTVANNTINGKPLYYLWGQSDVVVPADAGGLIAVDCDGIIIDGLDVSDSSMGIQVVHSSNVTVRNTVADRCGIFGIYLAYIEGGTVESVTVRESNHGIDIRKATNLVVTDCLAENCKQGVFIAWGNECVVDRCRMLYGGSGFWASVGENNQITRSLIEGNENGIYLQNEKNTLAYDNEITGNTVVGMRILKANGHYLKNNIHDNWTGIIIASTEHVTLLDNAFGDNGAADVYVRDLDGGKIINNAFTGEQGAFLELDGTLSSVLIRDNIFYGTRDQVTDRLGFPFDLAENAWVSE